jgi:hypothetical protein
VGRSRLRTVGLLLIVLSFAAGTNAHGASFPTNPINDFFRAATKYFHAAPPTQVRGVRWQNFDDVIAVNQNLARAVRNVTGQRKARTAAATLRSQIKNLVESRWQSLEPKLERAFKNALCDLTLRFLSPPSVDFLQNEYWDFVVQQIQARVYEEYQNELTPADASWVADQLTTFLVNQLRPTKLACAVYYSRSFG